MFSTIDLLFVVIIFLILKCEYSRLVSSPVPSFSPIATFVSRKKSPYQAEQSLLILKNNHCKCFLEVPEHYREELLLSVLATHSVQHFHPGFAGCFPTPPLCRVRDFSAPYYESGTITESNGSGQQLCSILTQPTLFKKKKYVIGISETAS